MALADPTRRAMLMRLSQGPAHVSELAKPFHMSLPAISKHLRVLERARLIEQHRRARWRICQLKAAPLRDACDWIEHYRQHWEESFDRLAAYLETIKSKNATATLHSIKADKRTRSTNDG